jgi:hypothetical protein
MNGRAGNSDIVDIAGEIREPGTPLAYRFFDGTKTVWLPRSLCEWDELDRTMAMPSWLAMDKGLI